MRLFLIVLCMLCVAPAWADYKPYPNAKVDQGLTAKARANFSEHGKQVSANAASSIKTVFTTTDSWEKVVAYYQKLGTEYKMPGRPGYETQLSGLTIKQAFFIFDGADLRTSKNWLTIVMPVIGDVKADGTFSDVRNGVTGISLVEPK